MPGDHHDYLVPNRGLDNEDPSLNQPDPRTDPLLQPGGQYSDWCPGNMQVATCAARYPLWIQAGLLYPYLNNLSVYRCPADHSLVPEIGALVRASAFLAHLFDELLGGFGESANLWPRPLESWREYQRLHSIISSNRTWPGPIRARPGYLSRRIPLLMMTPILLWIQRKRPRGIVFRQFCMAMPACWRLPMAMRTPIAGQIAT